MEKIVIRKSLIVFVFLGNLWAAEALSPADELRVAQARAVAAEAQAASSMALVQLLQSPMGRDFTAKQSLAEEKTAALQKILEEIKAKYADNRDPKPGPDKPVPAK